MSTRASCRLVRLRLARCPGLLLIVCAALLGPAAPADAAPAERDRQAGQLFYEGKYEEALKIYIELAFETKRPEYMCNIGRCYARLGRIDEAIHNMRDCLAQAPLDPRKRAEYETHVRALEAQRAQAAQAAQAAQGAQGSYRPPMVVAPGAVVPAPGATPAAPPQPGAPGAATTAPAAVAPGQAPPGWPPGAAAPAPGGYPAPYYGTQPPYGQPGYPPASAAAPYPPVAAAPGPATPPAPAVAESRARAKKKKRLLPFASYVTGAIGLVGITGGVAFGLQSKGIYDDLAVRFDSEREREAKRANTAQIVSYAVGGVALAAAVVIALVAERQPDGAAPGAVALAADRGAAGWSWRF